MTAIALSLIFLLNVSNTEPLQDPDNTCYLTNTCKPTGLVDNPFNWLVPPSGGIAT